MKRLVVVGALVALMVGSFHVERAEAALFLDQATLDASDEFAQDPMFDPVGLLVGTDINGDRFVAGSGVLIDPHWVLTAGHVPFDEGTTLWSGMQFSTSPDVLNNLDSLVAADDWFAFPGYSRNVTAGRGDDIALVRLADPITSIEPAKIFRGEDQVGSQIYTAGYGQPGVWPTQGEFDGVKRAGENIVEGLGNGGNLASNYLLTNFDLGG